MRQTQISVALAIAGLWVFGQVAVSFADAGITAAGINAFFHGLNINEVLAAVGVSLSGAAGFFMGKKREKTLIGRMAEGTDGQ